MTASETRSPQVGEIWEDIDGRKYFVLKRSRKYVHFLVRRVKYKTGITFDQRCISHFDYPHCRLTYVGKAKASINDFFKVREEK